MLKRPETAVEKVAGIIETMYKVAAYDHYDIIGSSCITLEVCPNRKIIVRLSTGFLSYGDMHKISSLLSKRRGSTITSYEAGKSLNGNPDWIFESEDPAIFLSNSENVDNFRDKVWSFLMKRYPNWDINSYIIIVKKHYYPNLSCEPVDTAVKQIEKAYEMIKQHKNLFGAIAIGMEKNDKKDSYTLQFFPESLSEEDANYISRNGGSRGFYVEKMEGSKWHYHTELRGDENLIFETWKQLKKSHPEWSIIDYAEQNSLVITANVKDHKRNLHIQSFQKTTEQYVLKVVREIEQANKIATIYPPTSFKGKILRNIHFKSIANKEKKQGTTCRVSLLCSRKITYEDIGKYVYDANKPKGWTFLTSEYEISKDIEVYNINWVQLKNGVISVLGKRHPEWEILDLETYVSIRF